MPDVAYDEELTERVRGELAGLLPGECVDERRMFGGLAFLVGGSVAVSGQGGLMVRVDPAEAEALLREPGVEQVVMGARGPDQGCAARANADRGEVPLADRRTAPTGGPAGL